MATYVYPVADGPKASVFQTAKDASAGLAGLVAAAAASAVASKGSFTLVLSGGSVLTALGDLIGAADVDWSKWWVFFVDERNVPHSSPDSNFAGAQEALLGRVPIPAEQIFAIKEGVNVQEAATDYEARLKALPASVLPLHSEGLPVFDLIVLGVGPDGHVASLFPNRPELAYTGERWVLPVSDSPKPPPERITYTLPVINSAKDVVVLALGEGKAEIVHKALEVELPVGALPAQLVQLKGGRAHWILDAGSGKIINVPE